MYIIKAERRDINMNAKQLKKSGLVPGSVYGSNFDKSLLIQLRQNEVSQLVKTKSKGNKISLNIDGKKYTVMIKEIGRSPVNNQIEHLSFQNLVNNEMVTSTARIMLLNKEKVTNFIQLRMFEIPYRAYPTNLVEQAEIDLEGKPAGTYVRVEDLDIAHNEDIELLVDRESLVLSII
jgi:large subunit ribosomal protein L25